LCWRDGCAQGTCLMTVPMCQTRDLLRAQLLSRLSAPRTPRAPACVGNLPGSADCWAFPSPASSSTRPMLLGWEQPGTRVELLLRQLLAGSTDPTGAGERLALGSGG